MYIAKMSRWVRGAIWAAGSCVVWCPVCVCLSGGGAWWVCACAVGLITITLGSGYTTWTVFNNLLRHGPQSYPLFAKCFSIVERVVERGQGHTTNTQEGVRSSRVSSSTIQSLGGTGCHRSSGLEPIMQEMVVTASSLHSCLVLPWYSRVSPDNHFSHQIKDVLEEMLTNMCHRVQESGSLTYLASGVIQIYVQHYRQYHRALRKVSKKHKDLESLSKAGVQDVQAKYKPLHPALKSPEALQLYYRKLAQILLQHYLPVEVTRCDLILISLRDLFAQNILQALVDLICDTQWLNTTLAEILSGVAEDVGDREGLKNDNKPEGKNNQSKNSLEILASASGTADNGEKLYHSNLLASIEEETVSDLQQLDPSCSVPAQNTVISESYPPKPEFSKDLIEEKKFENAEALVEYVRSSSLEKRESTGSEEEEYKSVSSALGTFISTTAGPLLPDNSSSLPYQPLVSKMWESPVEDKCFVDVQPVKKKKNPFSRNVVEGMKEEDYKLMYYPTKDKKTAVCVSSPDEDYFLVPKLEEGNIEIRVEDSESVNSKDTEMLLAVPSLRDIPRSKSCGNLVNKEKDITLDTEAKTLHSSLGELDQPKDKVDKYSWVQDASYSTSEGEELGNRKEKGHLVKMLSFDKNDGTDDASIQSSKLNTKTGGLNKGKQSPRSEVSQSGQNCISHDSVSSELSQTTNTTSSLDKQATDVESPNNLEIPGSPLLNNAGFGWDNPDLSPIYEESEDLASSIAKLRSLLTERESQHSLGSLSSYGSSDSEPKSAQSDPGRYSLEKSRFTFTHKDSSGSLASVKSVSSLESSGNGIADEELLEAAEIPLDGRVFLSICVPATEVHTEPGGAQYTHYTIQYDAIYLCESTTAAPATEGGEEGASEPVVISEPRMVLQTNCVKRRFREFLTLHAALEDDSRLRTAMKGVKGPNKWLNLPFSKLDSTTIATRKQFLEKYLQSVIQRPEVNISTHVKEFLAYGSDSSVSFVKKPLELHVPRLDKLLAKTVSGVFHSLKTALPSFESSDNQTGATEPVTNHSGGMSGGSGGDGLLKSKSGGGGVLSERNKLAVFLSSGNKAEYELKLDITAEEEDCQIEEALNREVSEEDAGGSWEEWPLSVGLLDAVVEILSPYDHPLTHQPCVTLLTLTLARITHKWLQAELEHLFCENSTVEYIQTVRDAILVAVEEAPRPPPSPEEVAKSRVKLQESFKDFIPGVLGMALGAELSHQAVTKIVDSLQHPTVNADLALHLLDLVATQLLPITPTTP
ncbi:Sorting nexin-19-like [Homarus americanus]|uniref:Sorting nexin-19-like n=1 Tax=Homarus americanus TaxID=6706 RepID=A0A8J5KCW0_HOMAM|nr:Sorting nexin-19-like [Homarus americanus]